MKNLPQFLLSILFLTTIASCSSSKFVTSKKNYQKLDLDFSPDNISIIDERESISEKDKISVPLFSLPNDSRKHVPKLKAIHKDIIKTAIRENLLSTSTENANIVFTLVEASEEFSATFASEKEQVFIKVKIKIEFNNTIKEASFYGEYHRTSIDASSRGFEKLFQKSLKEASYKALEKIKMQLLRV